MKDNTEHQPSTEYSGTECLSNTEYSGTERLSNTERSGTECLPNTENSGIERLGIYGGTFSPVHDGHIHAAEAFLKHIQPDKLLIMPTAVPPHKAEVVGASADDRLAMARLAFAGMPKTEVSDFETARQGKSYTVYTLEHFTRPNREIYLLVGTDMFLTLSRWYCSADIFRMAYIVLMRRERDSMTDSRIAALEKSYREEFGAKIIVLTDIPYELSSTDVRQSLVRGGTDCRIPTAVLDYIRTHHLYGTGNGQT